MRENINHRSSEGTFLIPTPGCSSVCRWTQAKPNTVQLRSRMVICGLRAGCGHRVCWVRFAAHLRTLRLTTRGLARARRTGLRRWASFPMAHCQRAPIASRL
jgi:hypothetical protein